jgi:hypothetical protein
LEKEANGLTAKLDALADELRHLEIAKRNSEFELTAAEEASCAAENG